jgi:hypothetical protein
MKFRNFLTVSLPHCASWHERSPLGLLCREIFPDQFKTKQARVKFFRKLSSCKKGGANKYNFSFLRMHFGILPAEQEIPTC